MENLATPTVENFRAQFPVFSDPSKYTDIALKGILERATCIISYNPCCSCVAAPCRLHAIYLLAAHLQALTDKMANGQGGAPLGFATSASIDKVSVSVAAPPTKNAFQYWLSMTPYGLELWAIIAAQSGIGQYFGGEFEDVFR